MLSGLRLTTCGGFLFPATNAAGDQAPATLRLTGRFRLGADSTSSALLTSFSECTRCEMLSRLSSFIAFASSFFHTCSQFSLYSNGYTHAYRVPNSRHKKGHRLLPLRPISGACCHHDSQTPAFTLLPVTPPADNRCGDNTRKDWGCQVVPEHHAKLHERHIAAYCHDNVSRLSLNCSGSRLAPVMLSGLRLTTCGGFLFPATNAAGDQAPQHCASPEDSGLVRILRLRPYLLHSQNAGDAGCFLMFHSLLHSFRQIFHTCSQF